MEACQLTVNVVVNELRNPGHRSISQTVISYLQLEDLKALAVELEHSSCHHSFGQLIRAYFFLYNYLNKVDRTFYYNFYEHSDFIALEKAHIATFTTYHCDSFLGLPSQYRGCLDFISGLIPEEVGGQDLAQEIERIVTDTCIPLPKLKRENQGIFCKTSFQNFLVDLKYQQQCECFPPFDQVQAYFEGQEQKYLQKLFMRAAKDSNLDLKVRSLRFTPFQINYHNFQEFLVQRNSLHNLLVGVYALTDIMLDSIHRYIQSLDDPFHLFVQLITRYSIYRNYIIEIEESLSFAFEQYDELYSQVFGSGKPKYRFWRAAMTKWLLKFEHFHQKCNRLYQYCLTKLRTEELLGFLDEKETQNPHIYMRIKNKAYLREHQMNINETVRNYTDGSNGLEDFFAHNHEQYMTILIEYLEYMVDLSVNEETVHWCGHSSQPLSKPYVTFEKELLVLHQDFLKYLRNLQDGVSRAGFQLQYFQHELRFMQKIEIKPKTLRKIVELYNLQLSDCPTLEEDPIKIGYDFQADDETLKYFNQKANIKFNLGEEQICFYSITPLISPNELLTKSISTAYDSELMDSEQGSQYEDEYRSNSSEVEDYQEESCSNMEESVRGSLTLIKDVGDKTGKMQEGLFDEGIEKGDRKVRQGKKVQKLKKKNHFKLE